LRRVYGIPEDASEGFGYSNMLDNENDDNGRQFGSYQPKKLTVHGWNTSMAEAYGMCQYIAFLCRIACIYLDRCAQRSETLHDPGLRYGELTNLSW
jgi:hypothetical protein